MSTEEQSLSQESIVGAISSIWNMLTGVKDIEKSLQGGNPFKAYNSRNISSRIYIEDSLENESVLIKVLNMLQGLYASAVLALVDESKYINSVDTVASRISNISPEQATLKFKSTIKDLNDYVESIEFGDKRDNEAKELPPLVRKFVVTFNDGQTQSDNKIEIPLFISLYPTFMKQEDLRMVLGTESSNSNIERAIMYRTGEIRFIRDFIFNFDVFKRKKRAYLKSVKSDYQRQYYENLDEKKMKALQKTWRTAKNRGQDSTFVNVANSIIVMSMNTKNLLKTESSLDLDNIRERNELYKETMSMIFVVLDSRYNKCYLYINGVNEKITFNYDQINFRFDSKNDILKILDNIKSLRDDSTISF